MTRTRLAFIVSPLVAVLTVWSGGLGYSLLQADKLPPGGVASHSLFFFLLFGAPVAYAVARLLASPCSDGLLEPIVCGFFRSSAQLGGGAMVRAEALAPLMSTARAY